MAAVIKNPDPNAVPWQDAPMIIGSAIVFICWMIWEGLLQFGKAVIFFVAPGFGFNFPEYLVEQARSTHNAGDDDELAEDDRDPTPNIHPAWWVIGAIALALGLIGLVDTIDFYNINIAWSLR